jgi:predicted Rossmann-fold nucleotide-binding protein
MLRYQLHTEMHDLVSPDGRIIEIKHLSEKCLECVVLVEEILPVFVGFAIDPIHVFFNLKSVLAQLGINGIGVEYEFDRMHRKARIRVLLTAFGPIAIAMLQYLKIGAYIGRLFAADPRRRVTSTDYLYRMFSRADHQGRPLLALGGMQGSENLVLDIIDGRAIAYLTLKEGCVGYEETIYGFLPTLGKALIQQKSVRELLSLHQNWNEHEIKILKQDHILLVKTWPLHIRTVFARVVNDLLPAGYRHTTASILQPDTQASGDIYELFGESQQELTDIPLEFYTLEPLKEHVFFSDRDQLQNALENEQNVFKAFAQLPADPMLQAASFIAKEEQLQELKADHWYTCKIRRQYFPSILNTPRQALLVERCIQQQACYPFLRAIEEGLITSQGVLFTRYFPTPLLKRMLLSNPVQRCLKRIYFLFPSYSRGDFFSHEDRALLNDLAKFAIPIFWVDSRINRILEYVKRPQKDSGMFVPLGKQERFRKATFFGVYGSNLVEGSFEKELITLLSGVQQMQHELYHALLNPNTPLALVTGGGPGAMELGNRVAQSLNILSCANIIDFRSKDPMEVINEQIQNPYVEAKMTYSLDKLIERQAEFHLDFPIFLTGGIGTDFELALEEVNRKVGSSAPHPVLLFGAPSYWEDKISARFKCNLQHGTIAGSEWVSNCFYCVETAEQGLAVYRAFFEGKLPIGKRAPFNPRGFVLYRELIDANLGVV